MSGSVSPTPGEALPLGGRQRQTHLPPSTWGRFSPNPADPSPGSLCQVSGAEKPCLQAPGSLPCSSPETQGIQHLNPFKTPSPASTPSKNPLPVHSHKGATHEERAKSDERLVVPAGVWNAAARSPSDTELAVGLVPLWLTSHSLGSACPHLCTCDFFTDVYISSNGPVIHSPGYPPKVCLFRMTVVMLCKVQEP